MPETDDVLKSAYAALQAAKWTEAELLSRLVLRKRPTSASAIFLLGHAISERGDDFEALRLFRDAIFSEPTFTAPYHQLSRAYYSLGKHSEAAELYRTWYAIEPNNPEVQHMTAAMTGQEVPLRCSDAYVHTHFNQFALNFDDVLVKRLAYRGPEVIEAALKNTLGGPASALDILDAGCGTGLCGPLLRPYARTLIGVDLADKMLEHARKKECYDELVVCELCKFIESRPESFDAIVSSDVLIYFGDLEEAMRAAHGGLRANGTLAITVEALQGEGPEPYRLTPSGRYAHRDTYLRRVLEQTGFTRVCIELEWLRWETGLKVMSHSITARKMS